MERSGLLKRFLEVVSGLMAQTEDHPIDRSGNVRGIFQTPGKNSAHPIPRLLSRLQDRVAAGLLEDAPILSITNYEGTVDILPSQIGFPIELARVAGRFYWLGSTKKFDLITEIDSMVPSGEKSYGAWSDLAVDFDGFRF